MPGQPSPTVMEADAANGVDFCLREVCDDPSESLVVAPFLEFDLEQTDSGNVEDEAFQECASSSNLSEEDLAENWDPFLYTLQAKAPKPKCVICKKEVDRRPSYYGEEFHGLLSREEAERLLGNEDGRYLTRENPRGENILSFMLDGKMWNYLLYYENEGHFVGDKKFDKVEELVEDGLITLFLKKYNVGQAMEKGRSLVRQKTMKLRRRPCRRVKGRPKNRYARKVSGDSFGDSVSSETQLAVVDFRHSVSSEPDTLSYRKHSNGSTSELRHDSTSAPLTPNSDAVQSDLDFTPPTQRRCSPPLDVPYSFQHRKRSNCLDTESFIERRKSKSSENLQKALLKDGTEAKGKYSPIVALRDAVRAEKLELSRSMDLSPLIIEDKEKDRDSRRKKRERHSVSPGTRPKSTVGVSLALALTFGLRSNSLHSRSAGSLEKVASLSERKGFTLPASPPVKAHQAVGRISSNSSYPYYKSHRFQPHNYVGPTWCNVCHHYLWGLKQQGLQCKDCGTNVHHQCIPMAMDQECKPTRKMIKKVYGVDLTTLVKLEGTKIPTILRECIHEIEARDLSVQGIYRVSGKSSEIIDLKDKWNSGDPVDFSQYEDINIITGAVKLYLRELPIPLVSFDTYNDIIKATATINDPEDPKVDWQPLADSLKLLPKAHYNILKYLAQHLHRVEQLSDENKMSASNLAVVFAPTLMRPQNEDLTLFKDFSVQRHFVEYIILKHDVLFDE